MDTQRGPLSGFRVLELGNLIAAPKENQLCLSILKLRRY
jgi:crotonobetainyl-CoA:carnitine CoA-transferase CaiB-like acyl-CoA transferase